MQARRDFYAGGLLILIGAVAIWQGISLRIDTLSHMGPGFMPLMLGAILVLLGLVIAGGAVRHPGPAQATTMRLDWRGWGCIVAGPMLFILIGAHGGLVPATFACVFVSAFGDRTAKLKSSFVLAAGVTVFGAILFVYLLRVPFPLFRW